jgi:hypothetical protein
MMHLLRCAAGFLLLAVPLLAPSAFGSEPAGTWWSFQPLVRPALPSGTTAANPIDRFIHAGLKQKCLHPAPEADRRTLVRRITFDLTGLPPTPAEIDAFLADATPDAYEKLVDRLLASPAYGERMARLWMDMVHFAETHGHDQDRVRPNAWRYRDYLIAAFNADTPYGQFIREQIAADVLHPDQPRLVPALGFLAAGPWDESSLRDIREDSIDREIARYLDRDDIITTVMNTFQGVTIQCARCHDHKFDPITQEDYYRLQAVFAGVGRGDVPFETDSKAAARRKELQETLLAIERNDPKLDGRFGSAEFRKVVADWEARHAAAATPWTVPEYHRLEASDGSRLVKQQDGSVRSEGQRPERDTYTVAIRVKDRAVTAVRLELLSDDTLPHRGPGRQDNGNLHLSEFSVSAALVKDGAVQSPRKIDLRNPTSDYDQPGWTIDHAVDGNPRTAWGIYPQVGKPHEAVFEFGSPVTVTGETELTFQLAQLHGGGHLIGRFRLSITSAEKPVQATAINPSIRLILGTPEAARTAPQRRELGLHVLEEVIKAELAAIPPPAMVYAASPNFKADGSHKPTANPRPVHILKRGDIRKPGPLVEAGALTCLPSLSGNLSLEAKAGDGERRAALAKWLTDANNPLTWRVMSNRLWQFHFGRGLVDSPNDFGKMGQRPTHPELLDWLACDLREHQSLRRLHKLIVTSLTYRQTSTPPPAITLFGVSVAPDPRLVDADNKYLWRQNRTRLDAEQVRDAILAVSGRLDRTPGGPSDQQFAMKPGIHVTPVVEYGKFDWDRPQGHRRSVYRFVFRTLPDPFVSCLDGADASQLTPKRTESVTALQALSLLNNEFVLVHAKAMAARLEKMTPDRARQITAACELLWARPPTEDEARLFAAHAGKHGLASLCRVLFNTNEFLFAE